MVTNHRGSFNGSTKYRIEIRSGTSVSGEILTGDSGLSPRRARNSNQIAVINFKP